MALGMEMLLQGMGVDPAAIQNNVNTAVALVRSMNDRIGNVETAMHLMVESYLKPVHENVLLVAATSLRIENAVDQLSKDAAENTHEFVSEFAAQNPNAAAEMVQQLNGGYDGGKDTGNDTATDTGTDTGNDTATSNSN